MKRILLLSFCFHAIFSLHAQFGFPQRITNNAQLFPAGLILPADLDQDGDQDLVGAYQSEGRIVWMENLDGQGTLGDPELIHNFNISGLQNIKIADFDGNGASDIMVRQGQKLYWLPNEGAGPARFRDLQLIGDIPPGLVDFSFSDLDGDSLLDFMVITSGNGFGWFHALNRRGQVEPYEVLAEAGGWAFALGDLDHDGDSDVVVHAGVNGHVGAAWLENVDGHSDFGAPVHFSEIVEASTSRGFHLADMDGDGDTDILQLTFNAGTQRYSLRWYENMDGQGSFGNERIVEDTLDGSPAALADYDQDGDLDIAMAQGGMLSIYRNLDGKGNFETQGVFPTGRPGQIVSTDINGDGFPDLIVIQELAIASQGLLFKNRGNGSFEPPIEFLADSDDLSWIQKALMVGDIDGVEGDELILAPRNYDRLEWIGYNGSEQIFSNARIIDPNPADCVVAGDIDQDGDPDLTAVLDYGTYGTIVWYENHGDGLFLKDQKEIGEVDNGTSKVWLEDWDQDGDLDLFLAKDDGFPRGLFWFENSDGDGAFSGQQLIFDDNALGITHDDVFLTDFDQDGDLDFLFYRHHYDEGVYWMEREGSTFADPSLILAIEDVIHPAFADLNRDGLADFICINDEMVQVRYNSVASLDTPISVGAVLSPLTSRVSFVDGDDDGALDIYVAEYITGILFYRNLGKDNGFAPAILETALSIDPSLQIIGANDFNRDGDTDIITYQHASKTLFYHENLVDKPIVRGIVFWDENENSERDSAEIAVWGSQVSIEPRGELVIPTETGEFTFYLADGDYELTCTAPPYFRFITPSSQSVKVLNDTADTEELLFGLVPDSIFTRVGGALNSGPLRCGFHVPFWLDYRNEGMTPSNIEIALTMDSLATFVHASLPPDTIVGDTLFWTIQDVLPTQGGGFLINFEIAGVEFIGEWINIQVRFTSMPSSGEGEPVNHFIGYRAQINCAFDPNDKLVEPNIAGHPNYTLFGDTLDYTIRFQNTGTDTAFTVRLEDYLDPALDWSSLRLIGSSHPCETRLNLNTGKLQFIFEQILLPDSSTNEIRSHGYVRFQLQHLEGLPEYTYVQNEAGIYFDFNPPIITNTVENILVSAYPVHLNISPPSCQGKPDGRLEVARDLPFYDSYTWSTGDTGKFIDSLAAGEYGLTITMIDGGILDTTIILPNPDSLSLQVLEHKHIRCFGDMDGKIFVKAAGGSPTYFYEWSNGSTSPLLDDMPAGEYTLTLTDYAGCSREFPITIQSPPPLTLDVTVSPAIGQEANGTILAEGAGGTPPYTYRWNFDPQETGNYLENLAPGIYVVTLTDANHCKLVEMITLDQVTSIKEKEPSYHFEVSPNPNRGFFELQVKVEGNHPWEVQLWNASGRLLRSLKPSSFSGQVYSFDLASGTYVFTLYIQDERMESRRVVVY